MVRGLIIIKLKIKGDNKLTFTFLKCFFSWFKNDSNQVCQEYKEETSVLFYEVKFIADYLCLSIKKTSRWFFNRNEKHVCLINYN